MADLNSKLEIGVATGPIPARLRDVQSSLPATTDCPAQTAQPRLPDPDCMATDCLTPGEITQLQEG